MRTSHARFHLMVDSTKEIRRQHLPHLSGVPSSCLKRPSPLEQVTVSSRPLAPGIESLQREKTFHLSTMYHKLLKIKSEEELSSQTPEQSLLFYSLTIVWSFGQMRERCRVLIPAIFRISHLTLLPESSEKSGLRR